MELNMAVSDDNNEKSNFIVGGYRFLTKEDAEKATMDMSKINLLETRVKASKPNDIHAVYEKAIENKIFKTPIGWRYLIDLREKLLSNGYSKEDIVPIPLEISMTRHSAFENIAVKQRVVPDKKEKNLEFKRIFPIVLNVVLIIVVILMFVMASTSENDNIINYKRNITNRYSSWDEELKEREKTVREAEKRLGITDSKGYDEKDTSN
jgi:hypothetical protein